MKKFALTQKVFFEVESDKLTLHSNAERFNNGAWNHIKSTFVFVFLEKSQSKIKLMAKDHLGVEKTLNLDKIKSI